MSESSMFFDPDLVDSLLSQHVESPGVLDDEVLEHVQSLNVAINFLPMHIVFLAKVYEKAHKEVATLPRQPLGTIPPPPPQHHHV